MIKRTLGWSVLLLCSLLLSSCSTTPEAAVRRQLPTALAPGLLQSYSVVAVEDASDGRKFVVMAPAVPPTTNDYPKLVFAFVRNTWFGWQADNDNVGQVLEEPNADNSIITGQRFVSSASNAATKGAVNTGSDPFVIGRESDLDPRVVAVEVVFDDRRTLQAQVNQHAYAIINPVANTPCIVRFLDANNKVVREIDWGATYGAGVPNTCSHT